MAREVLTDEFWKRIEPLLPAPKKRRSHHPGRRPISHRQALRKNGIQPFLAERNTEHGSHLGRVRWVVEGDFAWFHGFGKLRRRTEKMPAMHEAFMQLAAGNLLAVSRRLILLELLNLSYKQKIRIEDKFKFKHDFLIPVFFFNSQNK